MKRKCSYAIFSFLFGVTFSDAQEWGSKEWLGRLSLFAPQQQSECEIVSNKVRLAHPRAGMFELMEKYHTFNFGPASPPGPPLTYRDTKTGITFYVESDGRHVAAINAIGKLLWIRNPFVDTNMCPYRSAHPYIRWIGAPSENFGNTRIGPFKPRLDREENAWVVKELKNEIKGGRKVPVPEDDAAFVGVRFDSSNFGYLNINNGDYYDMGQN